MAPQLLAYDVHTNHWTQLAAPPLAKSWPSITTGADGRIYVVGPGLYASKDNSAEVYDPASNRWSVLPSLALADPGAAVATGADGRVYVVGGSDPNTGKTVTDVRTFPS
jgi:N-acetylneuraminic acid mutarotase